MASPSLPGSSANANTPARTLPPQPPLPLTHLDSLKFKSTQIIDSLTSLAGLIEYGFHPAMPPWPDVLAKYAVLVSQTHVFASALAPVAGLALHPRAGLPDHTFDTEVIPLLRNQQTTEVLRAESAAVRRLTGHTNAGTEASEVLQNHARVLADWEQMRDEHDRRADRAKRAVAMLREKYDWKVRVAVEPEDAEEEEDWTKEGVLEGQAMEGVEVDLGTGAVPSSGSGNSSEEDEQELENVLGTGAATPEPDDIQMANE